jgi:hypothetical protein
MGRSILNPAQSVSTHPNRFFRQSHHAWRRLPCPGPMASSRRLQGGGNDIGYDEAVTPSGISILADDPKPAGASGTFTGVATFGQAVTFSWGFGDGDSAAGKVVTQGYLAA